MLALCVFFLQPFSSAGRKFAASRSRLNYYGPTWIRFHKDEFDEMFSKLDSSEYALARSFKQIPTLPQ